jgi:tetratricopeptide (TPR) repeat protein
MQLEEFGLAKGDFLRILEISPKNIKALRRLALLYKQQGFFGDSLNFLQKCANFEPREPSHRQEIIEVNGLVQNQQKALSLIETSKYEDALPLLADLVEKAPFFQDIKLQYINCLIQLMKFDQVYTVITTKRSKADKENLEFDFLCALALYYHAR